MLGEQKLRIGGGGGVDDPYTPWNTGVGLVDAYDAETRAENGERASLGEVLLAYD